jgi:hypothetical protein
VWGNGEKGAVLGLGVLVYSGNSTDEWGNVLVLHSPSYSIDNAEWIQNTCVVWADLD